MKIVRNQPSKKSWSLLIIKSVLVTFLIQESFNLTSLTSQNTFIRSEKHLLSHQSVFFKSQKSLSKKQSDLESKQKEIYIENINNNPSDDTMGNQDPVTLQSADGYMNIKNKCNDELLKNYFITGYDVPQLQNHKFCPNITYNCCSNYDQEKTMEVWNDTIRPTVQKYYSSYINSIRYVFGFYHELNHLAVDIINKFTGSVVPGELNSEGEQHEVAVGDQVKMNSKCLANAQKFLEYKFDKELTSNIMNGFIRQTNSLVHLRSSFFCTLCDGQAQEILKHFWEEGDQETKDTMFFSNSFCDRFVNDTVDGAYYYNFYLKNYLNHAKAMFDCKLGDMKNEYKEDYAFLKFDIEDPVSHNAVHNCYYNRSSGVYENCKDYCSLYNLSSTNRAIDGDVNKLYQFVDFIYLRKNAVFKNPLNAFAEDADHLRDVVEADHEDSMKIDEFFKPQIQNNYIDSMKSDVTVSKGIDPYLSGEQTMYKALLAFNNIFKVSFIVTLSLIIA